MAKKKRKKDSGKSSISVDLTGCILILIGIIGVGFGPVGAIIKKFAMFLAGDWWILPLIGIIALGSYMLFKRKDPKYSNPKIIGIIILLVVLLVASHYEFLSLKSSKEIITTTYNNYMERMSSIPQNGALDSNGTTSIVIGGGFIGAVVLSLLYGLFGKTGTTIVLVLLSILGLILLFDVTLSELFAKLFKPIKNIFNKDGDDDDEDDEVLISDHNTVNAPEQPEKVIITSVDELKRKPMDIPQEIEPLSKTEDDSTYRLPRINEIFDPIKENKKTNSAEFTKNNKETLERVLNDFGITAKVVEIHIGPAVTQYELTVPAGTKVSKIFNLNKEIALALAAKDVRIQAPIPGKNTIGVEIPNQVISSVTLREVLESPENIESKAKLCAALGKDIMGTPKVFDLSTMPHLLVAGSTGSGKSVCINGIIVSLLMRYKPTEVKLVLVDPKKVELTNYNGIPHLLCPVVSDPKKASLTLQKVVTEMDQRFQLFSEKEVKNISGYNEWVEKENKKHPDKQLQKMPYIVAIIDELADLMLVASKEVEDSITRITQLARAAGIHLIVATQRPSTDVITGLIKNNIPSRISFAVSSQIDSRTILDQPGAEKLLGKGDMLYFPMGESSPTRIQGCFVNDNEIAKIINYCKGQADAKYDDSFANPGEANSSSGSNNSFAGDSDDEAYNEVVDFAISTGKISASLIQRRFRFGYNRAARMMDLLEARGIVGPQNGSKPREVLVKLEESDKE